MLKLKLQYFGHLMQRTDSLEKTLMLGKIEGGRRGWQRMRGGCSKTLNSPTVWGIVFKKNFGMRAARRVTLFLLTGKLSAEELMLLNCGVGEDSWESLGLQGDPTSPFWRRSVLGVHWKDWWWSWSSSSLVMWCEKLKWCWERLRAEGEEGVRGWDSWMASLMQWTWTWASLQDMVRENACCSPWCCKELVMAGWLNSNSICTTSSLPIPLLMYI